MTSYVNNAVYSVMKTVVAGGVDSSSDGSHHHHQDAFRWRLRPFKVLTDLCFQCGGNGNGTFISSAI